MKDLDIIGSEMYAILSNVSKERYNKIPTKITKLFDKYKDLARNIKILPNVEFENQEIRKETKDLIFILALKYWLTDEEKEIAIKNIKVNEEKLKEKYNIEKIFNSMNQDKKEDAD